MKATATLHDLALKRSLAKIIEYLKVLALGKLRILCMDSIDDQTSRLIVDPG